MAEQVLMLALSPTMEEGTIVKWHKKEGDSIAQSDIICEVETDKATMEYESVNEGTLLKILISDGGQAKVGDPIAGAKLPVSQELRGLPHVAHEPKTARLVFSARRELNLAHGDEPRIHQHAMGCLRLANGAI